MISGTGGDGAVFLGKTLSLAAMEHGYHTSGLPSYGPEVRGGTSRCAVIVSDEPIGSPVFTCFESLIVFNEMSLDRFEPGVVPGGVIVLNRDVVTRAPARSDVEALAVNASAEAQALGNARLMNVVTLGVWAARRGQVLGEDALAEGLRHLTRDPGLFELNRRALRRGMELGEAMAPAGPLHR